MTNPFETMMADVPVAMKPIIAIDPGTTESASVMIADGRIIPGQIEPNVALLAGLRDGIWRDGADETRGCHHAKTPIVAIEMVACYGMSVGKEVFETCLMIGRLLECCHRLGWETRLVYRREVKIWLCGSMKAKDGNIRQALIDKYGAPGTKKAPGGTYGISSHLWSALAIADFALNNPQP